jgi:hypothetical protein
MSFLNNPYIAVIIFILFLVGFFIYLDLEGSFANGFLHFGPGSDKDNTTRFMGIEINSWSKVLTLYALCFFTGLLKSYYDMTVDTNIIQHLGNPNVTTLPYTKSGVYAVGLIDPLIMHSLWLLEILITITVQFQFIFPLILGEYIGDLPYLLSALSSKEFSS